MKSFVLIILGLAFFVHSCDTTSTDDSLFNATVIGKGMDCGNHFLIQYDEDASGVPINNFDNIFYELNLPEEYKVPGKRIMIEFRLPFSDEITPCTAMGPGYPQVFVTKVVRSNSE